MGHRANIDAHAVLKYAERFCTQNDWDVEYAGRMGAAESYLMTIQAADSPMRAYLDGADPEDMSSDDGSNR